MPKPPPETTRVGVPAGLVVLVGPPASGKTGFVRELVARGEIDGDAVVSSDAIRAELFDDTPPGAADARIFEERDRRIAALLAAGRGAIAESTNVTPRARARLIALARRYDAPVTVLRFDPDLPDLLRQHAERGRTDLTAADVRAYAAVMARDGGADRLRAEGAAAVHDVPGRRQATTSAEAAARFSFARFRGLTVTDPALSGGETADPVIVDAGEPASGPEREEEFAGAAHRLLADLVRGGAALGWVEPPSRGEVAELLGQVRSAVRAGDAALRAAYLGGRLAGFGYWVRYARPTHRPHADLEKLAVEPAAQGRGIGRALTAALIADARRAGIEVLTLDARGDNTAALGLYRSLGFSEYGRLAGFVAVGERRYDKVLCLLDLRRRD